jgi:hypothetical protein
VTEPRGEERREFVEDLERRTAFVRDLLEEIDRQRQQAEQQGFNFIAPTVEQLKKNSLALRPLGSSLRHGLARLRAVPSPMVYQSLIQTLSCGSTCSCMSLSDR